MKWIKTLKAKLVLIAYAAASLCALAAAELIRTNRPQPDIKLKQAAVTKMQQGIEVVARAYRRTVGEIDPQTDPRRTGLIGSAVSSITHVHGALESKQITTDPNFAALVVKIFRDADLGRGDVIAVAWTGSLPGANLAVMSAADAMGLEPIIITSVSSSMYGANIPEFTWLDMEKALRENDVFTFSSVSASLGGDSDIGGGLSKRGRKLAEQAIERSGAEKLAEPNLTKQVSRRLETYYGRAGKKTIKAYVNVGGGMGSIGARVNLRAIRPGLNKSVWGMRFHVPGAMTVMARKGMPVIHIGRIEQMCSRYGFEGQTAPQTPPGQGPMFHKRQPSMTLTAAMLVMVVSGYVLLVGYNRRRIARRQQEMLI